MKDDYLLLLLSSSKVTYNFVFYSVYNSQSVGLKLSSSFTYIEKVGCGIKFDGITNGNDGFLDIPVFFTVDGTEVCAHHCG